VTVPGLSYPEVGATAGDLPAGYHHVRATRSIGHGRSTFDAAAADLLLWRMHERAGVHRIAGPNRVLVGRDMAFRWLVLRFECRVISITDEPHRRGFTYGTLARHPERGEERFMIDHDPVTDEVTATITAFSRPSSWLIRAAGPFPRLVQARMTRRYLASLG
jgi:uncharacterized protein (UPF0548 family)